jgi:superfamily II DNA or RNA helicase
MGLYGRGRCNFCNAFGPRGWQKMPLRNPGQLLKVRGGLWRLRRQTTHASCSELELEQANSGRADVVLNPAGAARAAVVLLEPFDRPQPVTVPSAPHIVTRRGWMTGLLTELANQTPGDRLAAAAPAGIDVLGYQLEPAIAMALHGTPRVLLADAVGLGKTIQAALVIAELRARGDLRRALVLAPAGLRDQWAAELRDRFGLDPVVADAAWLHDARANLPTTVNPWTTAPLVIASIDFIKRADALRSVDAVRWDLVVVDEAHSACADTQRRTAVHQIGRRARRVLLLTATPHSGDGRAFASLCDLGAASADESLVLFRRTRPDVGLRITRRVRLLQVRQRAAERDLHARLLAYVNRLWRESHSGRQADARADLRLAATVLLKRAFSSARSLALSLEFRLKHLADPVGAMMAQLDLPLDGDDSADDDPPMLALATTGFDDEADERRVLQSLVDLARAASARDSKIAALARLLRRVNEPCIVFTEYRDTLRAIEEALPPGTSCAVLHGALDRASRSAAVRQFTSGRARVLLATDAGGEGLNLQAGCRLVVNLELPWNPMRLEQRIGRVDRIGQQRAVHVINLVAGGSREMDVLARLVHRMDRIRESLGDVDEVLGDRNAGGRTINDEAVAAVMSGCEVDDAVSGFRSCAPDAGARPSWRPADDRIVRTHVHAETQAHVDHAIQQRALLGALDRRSKRSRSSPARTTDRAASDRAVARRRTGGARAVAPLVATVPARRLRGEWARAGTLAVYRTSVVDGTGRIVDDGVLPVFSPSAAPEPRHRCDVATMARQWLALERPSFDEAAEQATNDRATDIAGLRALEALAVLPRSRVQQLVSIGDGLMIQPGLFDRRSERAADEQRRLELEDDEAPGEPSPAAYGDAVARALPPQLRLLLMVTP